MAASVPARAVNYLRHGFDDHRVLVLRAYRFRLYPTREQRTLLEKTFGCKRYIWNKMLKERETWYHEHGTDIGKTRKTRPHECQ